MRKAILTGINELSVIDAPAPEVRTPHDVLLRMDAIGVCGDILSLRLSTTHDQETADRKQSDKF